MKVKEEWYEEIHQARQGEIDQLQSDLEDVKAENTELKRKIEHYLSVIADLHLTYGVCE